MLYQENRIFGWLPIETIIAANQEQYYEAIHQSTKESDSGIFAEFMLKVIAKVVHDFREEHADSANAEPISDDDSKIILELLQKNPSINYDELSQTIGKTTKTVGRILSNLKDEGIIERVGSNKTGYWKINLLD